MVWKKINGYPKQGDYIKAEYKGKKVEGFLTGERAVSFRTGFVAREITRRDGLKQWVAWTPKASYYKKVGKDK